VVLIITGKAIIAKVREPAIIESPNFKRLTNNAIPNNPNTIDGIPARLLVIERTNFLNQFSLVYNFVDMMSHARTEMEMMRELASDEAAYLSITKSWFLHSDLWALIKEAASQKVKLIITSDHGTIRVQNPVKIVGDKATSTNLRYKLGRNLNYNPKEVFEIRKPEEAHLPKPNISSSFVFAYGNDFFAYPNNYNYYVKYYRNTFQHGGISLDEMLIPLIELKPIE